MKIFKNKSLLVIGVIVIVVVAFGGVIQVGKAQVEKSRIAELTELAESLNNADAFMAGLEYLADEVGDMLGSSGTRFPNGISADTTSPIAGEVRGTTFTSTGAVTFGGTTTLTGAVTLDGNTSFTDGGNTSLYFHRIISCTDATNTAALFNPDTDGYDDFELLDLWIENTGKATSTVRIAVTTTTATSIASDDTTILDGDAGVASIMKTLGNAFGADGATFDSATATGTPFTMFHYPGDETRIADGTGKILINSTTNIAIFATSTDDGAILAAGNTFDCKLHVVGKQTNR